MNWFRWVAVLCLLAAFLVRSEGLGDLPAFQPTREYLGLSKARAYHSFFLGDRASPPGSLEPPVLDVLTAVLCLPLPDVIPVVPRVLSVSFWLSGALALFCACRRSGLLSRGAAFLPFAYVIAVPFSSVASRAVQPDPLAVALTCCMLWAACRYVRDPSWATGGWVSCAAGAAMFVKLPMAFFALPVCAAAFLQAHGRSALSATRVWALSLGAIFPAAVWLARSLLTRSTPGSARAFLVPQAVWGRESWAGDVLFQLKQVTSLPCSPVLAFVGLLLLRRYDRTLGNMILAWFVGYLLFLVVFAHHTATHNYYHLPFLPVVAVSLAGFLEYARARAPFKVSRRGCLLAAVFVAWIGLLGSLERVRSERGLPQVRVEAYRSIGREIAPGSVLTYTAHYGQPLRYHARLTGGSWPSPSERPFRVLTGQSLFQGGHGFLALVLRKRASYFVAQEPRLHVEAPEVHSLLIRKDLVVYRCLDLAVYDVRPLWEHK